MFYYFVYFDFDFYLYIYIFIFSFFIVKYDCSSKWFVVERFDRSLTNGVVLVAVVVDSIAQRKLFEGWMSTVWFNSFSRLTMN